MPQPHILPPESGQRVRAFGNEILFKLTADNTAEGFSLGLATVPAGTKGPPPHVHENEDELFIVVEGQYRVFIDGQWSDVAAGSVVFLPRGVLHTLCVTGEQPGKHWVLTTPGGFDRYFARCAEVFSRPGPPDLALIAQINEAHGIQFQPAG